MNQAPLIARVERIVQPMLVQAATRMNTAEPSTKVDVLASPVGTKTEFQGYMFGLDCIFTDASDNEVDNISLCITIAYLDTTPKLSADVVWGNGEIVFELFPRYATSMDWALVDDELLHELEARLPLLIKALETEIASRKFALPSLRSRT